MSTSGDLLASSRFFAIVVRCSRALRRVAGRAPWRLAAFALLALLASWTLLSTAPALNDFRDAHVLAHYEQSAADSVTRYHQAPLWDPFYCGGMYLLGTPQARFASPTFAFTLLFGEARGAALTAFFMMLLGLEGAYRYARVRGAGATGAALAAPIFALSGVFAMAPGLGWFNFFGFELLPWIALGVHTALRGSRRGLAIAAVSIAWCVGFGGTYAVPLAAVWCVGEAVEATLTRLRTPRRALTVVARTAIVASFALGLSAFRLWPVIETLADAPRIIGGAPGTGYTGLWRMLFAAMASKTENGTYFIGVMALLAVALGVMQRRSLALVAYAWIAFWLAGGAGLKPSLFLLLRKLPVYGALRYPERFLILVALVACVLAARGITRAEALARARRVLHPRRAQAWWAAWAGAAILCVANLAPMVSNHAWSAAQRPLEPPPAVTERPFHQARGNRWALAYYEPMQRGSLSCWDAYPVPQSPLLRGDLGAEERLLDPASGAAEERRWSPNRIDVDVDMRRPGTLLVNQNWHRGWRASEGTVRDHEGLLAVDLPAGKRSVALAFSPRSATGGALVSLVTLLALLGLAGPWSRRVRPAAVGLAAASPLIALGLVLVLVHEAHGEPLELRTPHGEPVVADALTDGAIRIAARFEGGVTLEATSVSDVTPHAGDTIEVELDWSRPPRIPNGYGVFVHIVPSAGETLNGDHAAMSGVLSLDDAPADRTLRDVFPITLPADAGGKRWKVWVGLWRLRGDGTRVRLVSPGSAIVSEGRVLAADFEVR